MVNRRLSMVKGLWSMFLTISTPSNRNQLVVIFIALSSIVSAQKLSSNQLNQWAAEGDTLFSQEKFSEAAAVYSKIIEGTGLKARIDFQVLYKRSICYYYTKERDLALEDVSKFIKQYPYEPNPHILRAYIYRDMDESLKQIDDLDFVLRVKPSDPGLLKMRAAAYLDAKEYGKAKTDAQTAILFQDDPEAEAYLAFAHYNLNHADSALLALNKAIDMDYSYLPAYLYAGSFCLQEEQYDLALKYLNLALRVDAENSTAWFYKGVALVEMKNVDAGCSCLNKAFYLGNDDADGYIKEYCYPSGEN